MKYQSLPIKRAKDVVVASILQTTVQTVSKTKKDFLNVQKTEASVKCKKSSC